MGIDKVRHSFRNAAAGFIIFSSSRFPVLSSPKLPWSMSTMIIAGFNVPPLSYSCLSATQFYFYGLHRRHPPCGSRLARPLETPFHTHCGMYDSIRFFILFILDCPILDHCVYGEKVSQSSSLGALQCLQPFFPSIAQFFRW